MKRRDGGMRSIHHPVTPRTGFFPGFKVQKREAVGGKGKRRDRKVGFSDDVVVHILKMEEEEKGENEVEEGKDVEMNEE